MAMLDCLQPLIDRDERTRPMNMQARLARSAARTRKALAASMLEEHTPKAMKRLQRQARAARRAQVAADREAAAWDEADGFAF